MYIVLSINHGLQFGQLRGRSRNQRQAGLHDLTCHNFVWPKSQGILLPPSNAPAAGRCHGSDGAAGQSDYSRFSPLPNWQNPIWPYMCATSGRGQEQLQGTKICAGQGEGRVARPEIPGCLVS